MASSEDSRGLWRAAANLENSRSKSLNRPQPNVFGKRFSEIPFLMTSKAEEKVFSTVSVNSYSSFLITHRTRMVGVYPLPNVSCVSGSKPRMTL